MEIGLLLAIAFGMLFVVTLPVKAAAVSMGAQRTGFIWCLLAIIGSAIMHGLGIMVPCLGTVIAFLFSAIAFAAILGTGFLRGIGIEILAIIFSAILTVVLAMVFGLSLGGLISDINLSDLPNFIDVGKPVPFSDYSNQPRPWANEPTDVPQTVPTEQPQAIVQKSTIDFATVELPDPQPQPIRVTLTNKDCNGVDFYVDGAYVLSVRAQSTATFTIAPGRHTTQACIAGTSSCGNSVNVNWPNNSQHSITRSTSCDVSSSEEEHFSNPGDFANWYFTAVWRDRNYDYLWTLLTPSFHAATSPNGYGDYTNWWGSVQKVDVISVTVLENDGSQASISIVLTFHLKDGRKLAKQKYTYDLTYDSYRQTWLFDHR